jgi:hypothetical protein
VGNNGLLGLSATGFSWGQYPSSFSVTDTIHTVHVGDVVSVAAGSLGKIATAQREV